MNRFRLRFLLQELDLAGSHVILGRSPECQITLDDPLVSRRHAVIEVLPNSAIVSDLGSRNGVRINGALISTRTPLAHNDRIRLGTQDLVFLVADLPSLVATPSRPTGRIRQCTGCGCPYPGEVQSCPHCGTLSEAHPSTPFDAVTDLMLEPDASWALRLLLDVIQRSLDSGRVPEAERSFARAQREVESRIVAGRPVDLAALARLSDLALDLSRGRNTADPLAWALSVHQSQARLPDGPVIDRLLTLNDDLRLALRPVVEALLRAWQAGSVAHDRADCALRAERLRSWLGAAA